MDECKDCLYYEVCPLGLAIKGKTGTCLKFKNKADYAEVKHGEWTLTNPNFAVYKCSRCGEFPNDLGNYCPNCGAKMDGKQQKEVRGMELKPCPFCGGTAIVVLTEKELTEDPTKSDYTTVVCDYQQGGCGASVGYHQYVEDAVDAWNKRSVKK